VKDYFGKTPLNAYVNHSNMYERFGWEEVHVVIKPVKATIIGVTSNPVILGTQTITNNSSFAATFQAGITESVTDSVATTWSGSASATMGVDLGVEVGFRWASSSMGQTFSYTQEFGVSETTTHQSTIGTSSGISVTLGPHESVIASLSSSRGTLNALVQYEATLVGKVACNYNPTYKGQHFWGLGIEGVMGNHHHNPLCSPPPPPLPPLYPLFQCSSASSCPFCFHVATLIMHTQPSQSPQPERPSSL